MKKSINIINAMVFSALAIVITNPANAERTQARADTSREVARVAPAPRTVSLQQATQRMMRQLHPMRAIQLLQARQTNSGGQYKAPNEQPHKYEVADCTGSDGIPRVCCGYTPGGGGSTCDMFILLCDEMSGTTSAGGSNAASCSGEGVLE